MKLALGLIAFVVLFNLAFWSAVGVVAFHFISKLW